MLLNLAGMVSESIVDGPGLRLTVFTQGCRHHCRGCHNPETWSFRPQNQHDTADIVALLRANPLLDGLTLSGGDPFEQVAACTELALAVKALGLNVVTYTGYTIEALLADPSRRPLVLASDWLIDGRYERSLKTLSQPFMGSRNQRMIEVAAYLATLPTLETPGST
ncbi:MAG: anaerobic ribonucleoside-triphosphate reductase activating protein [Neisseriaceae bacterium]|nr:anaerobic ribonucleoside-triphosphate reductase activating protein [Neisseriaceae bacterium]MBP6863102.1 anaerobic ribonucleoside-triphosphate reductase activating protein [Neisseriaceae bacterium]